MKKLTKFMALSCVLTMLLTLLVPAVPTAALNQQIWDFEDYASQGASSYLTGIGFEPNSGAATMDIADKGTNGKMLVLKPGSRLIRWYYSGRPGSGTPITEDFVLELDLMQETKSALADIATAATATWQADKYLYQLISNGTDIQLRHGGGTATLVPNYQAGTVYNLKISVEIAAKRLKAWVNGVQVATDTNMTFKGAGSIPDVSRFDFNIGGGGTLFVGKMSISPYVDIENELAKLNAAINDAEDVLDSLEPGDYLGQCSQAAWNTFSDAINAAQASYDTWMITPPAEADLVTQAIQTLAAAQGAAEGSVNMAYSPLYAMDFDSKTLADDGWNVYQPNGEIVTVGDNQVLKVYNTGQTPRVLRSFTPAISSAATVSFSFMQEEKKAIYALAEIKSAPLSETDAVFTVSSTGSDIMLGSMVLIADYEANRWYDITLDLDPANRTIKAFVDGVRVLTDRTVPYTGSTSSILTRWETQIQSANGAVFIDDITIQKNINGDFAGEASALAAGFGDMNNVISDLSLPSEDNGYTITWFSNNESIMTNEGVVTRSETQNETVILTALIQKGDYTYKHKYVLTVPKLSFGLLIDSNFESDTAGATPADWSVQSGSATVAEANGNKYAAVSGELHQTLNFKDIYPSGFAMVDFMQSDKADVESILSLEQRGGSLFNIRSDGTDLVAVYDGGEAVIVEDYEAGTWYSINVPFDTANETFSVVVDDSVVLENKPLSISATGGTLAVCLDATGSTMHVDNVAVGRSKPAAITLTNDADSVLRPASGSVVVVYKAAVRDAAGRIIIGDDIIWSLKNASGAAPADITVADGVVTITPTGEAGSITVRAEMVGDASVYAEKTLEITAQRVKTIRISGKTNITSLGSYTYTAEVISEYDVVLPSAGIRWSISGSGATISGDGVLTVQSNVDENIEVKATLSGVSGGLGVSINTLSGGGGRGNGGGGGGIAAGPITIPKNNPTDDPGQNPTNTPTESITGFSDVAPGFWAEDAIRALNEKGIMTGIGDNNFDPNGQVTRAQFAKLLAETFNIPETSGSASFTDVAEDAWYSAYVQAVQAVGIITGYLDGSFGSETAITRQDVAVMLARALEYRGMTLDVAALSYADNNAIADYAAEAVGKVLGTGIMSGKDNNMFEPKSNMTRAEAAMVFYRVLSTIEG